MAKKNNPRKALKNLFSKSEANLKESGVEMDKNNSNGGDKKKFKFFKFKLKSKTPAAPDESQKVARYACMLESKCNVYFKCLQLTNVVSPRGTTLH